MVRSRYDDVCPHPGHVVCQLSSTSLIVAVKRYCDHWRDLKNCIHSRIYRLSAWTAKPRKSSDRGNAHSVCLFLEIPYSGSEAGFPRMSCKWRNGDLSKIREDTPFRSISRRRSNPSTFSYSRPYRIEYAWNVSLPRKRRHNNIHCVTHVCEWRTPRSSQVLSTFKDSEDYAHAHSPTFTGTCNQSLLALEQYRPCCVR